MGTGNRSLVFFFTLFFSYSLSGDIGRMWGFGARSQALSNSMVASGDSSFSSHINPAVLSNSDKLHIGYGLLYGYYDFRELRNIVVENKVTSDRIRKSNVKFDYPVTFGQVFSLSAMVFPKMYKLSLGFLSYFPMNKISNIDTGKDLEPSYFLYESRLHRPQFEVSMGIKPFEKLSFGTGVRLGYKLNGTLNSIIVSNKDKKSSMDLSIDLKPTLSPYFGISYISDYFSFGSVFRLALNSKMDLTVNSEVGILGDTAHIDPKFKALSSIYYDPSSVGAGFSFSLNKVKTYFQIEYEIWDKLKLPNIVLKENTKNNSNFNFSESYKYDYEFKNILIPRISQEIKLSNVILRLGYSYRPSIMKNSNKGAGNHLDPKSHSITTGLGFNLKNFLSLSIPLNLDISFGYRYIVSDKVVKVEGDELGKGSGDIKIGAPSYKTGGNIFMSGISISLDI